MMDTSGFGVFLASFLAGAVAAYFALSMMGKLVKKAPKSTPVLPENSPPRGSGKQIP